MRSTSFTLALVTTAIQSATALQSFNLGHNWSAEFDSATCGLKIHKHVRGESVSRHTLFESGDQMLTTGRGDVDDIKIMIAGNIEKFPKRQTRSSHMECSDAVIKSNSFSVSGQIVVKEADEQAGVAAETTDFNFSFTASDENRMAFKAESGGANSAELGTNYLSMSYESPVDEEIYGMGLQYSEWDFKGKAVPLISAEGGVGRGLQPITLGMNKFMGGQGGTSVTSYAPAAQYITNKKRGFVFDQSSIGIAGFDEATTAEMLYWHQDTISGTLLYGKDFLAVSQELSKTVGTMRPLPEWALQGAVVGIVGGQEFVDEKYSMMKQLELPMVGIWMQDWVGEHTYPEGTRLIWNW